MYRTCVVFLYRVFFQNSFLKNKISTARSGNVIGGGDYSKNRLLPDIIKSINSNKTLIVRKPKNIRPWQHVMDPLIGYLKLAEKQYKNKINNIHHWNFGPNVSSFVSVNEIIKIVKKNNKLKYKIKYNQNFFETEILKLNSNRAKKHLNWKSKWNLQKSINSVIEWNRQLNEINNARKICEKSNRRISKVKMKISYGKNVYNNEEIKAVLAKLKQSTQMGTAVESFEKKIAKMFSKKFGLMVNSGSSALILATNVLNLKKGDEVITPCLNFGTAISAVILCGATPILTDIDVETLQIKIEEIEKKNL